MRDCAVLALIASGVSCSEVARLRCRAINQRGEKVYVTVNRGGWLCRKELDVVAASWVLLWLSASGGYGTDLPLFPGPGGDHLTRVAVSAIVSRKLRAAG